MPFFDFVFLLSFSPSEPNRALEEKTPRELLKSEADVFGEKER